MRLVALSIVAATVTSVALSQTVSYAQEPLETAVAKTRRELEILKIEYRLFWTVEYPREQRELTAAILLTQAEVDAIQERVHYYKQFKRSEGSRPFGPFWDDLQEAELALLEAQLRLNNLLAERLALRRSVSDRLRLLELRIAATRAHLAELDASRPPAGDEVAPE